MEELSEQIGKARAEVVGLDLLGYPYNMKYPPDIQKYGDQYYGYPSWNHQVLFYEFACQGYDLRFMYHDHWYYAMANGDDYCTCKDEHYMPDETSIHFSNGNVLIEQWEIEGHKLIDIIDDLEEVEQM